MRYESRSTMLGCQHVRLENGGAVATAALAALALCSLSASARAWVLPEHAQITARALKKLDRSDATTAEVLAVVTTALRLCGDHDEHAPRTCPRLAVLPALAGDHSCTPGGLREALEQRGECGDWISGVLRVSLETQAALDRAGTDADQREDVRRMMHVYLQGEDPAYLKRALSDVSHFQIARQAGDIDLPAYLKFALAPTREGNATATYLNYHLVALRLASAGHRARDPNERAGYFVRAVLSEVFALHFLQDSFSSGHFVGHWGVDTTKLGTHDFYSRRGVAAVRWSDRATTYVAYGDGFLPLAERERVAGAVGTSLEQVLSAARGEQESLIQATKGVFALEDYDTCISPNVPPGMIALADTIELHRALADQPVPLLRWPPLPRVRAEKGLFVGLAGTALSGFVSRERTLTSDIVVGARVGIGAAGIVDDPLNAQAFLEAGFTGEYQEHRGADQSLTGYRLRLRVPSVVAFEGIVMMPLAFGLQQECLPCLEWASRAAAGGLARLWRSHGLFGTVVWQLSALRDVTVHYFPNEPALGQHRLEVFAPAFTARNVLPIAGDGVAQSTDIYFDIGPSFTWSSERAGPAVGVFASFSLCARLFP